MTISDTSRKTIRLGEAAELAVEEIGHKASTLAKLSHTDIPIPDGMILTTPWVGEASDEDLRRVLEDGFARLGGPLAVRSSALAEDTEERSFAGQYETVLSVKNLDDLVDAVHAVARSGESERVKAYGEGGPDVAVLIQKMVDAVAAGVAFTADPVTGERSVTIVSSVSGLGDRLVSGEVNPDEWEVRAGSVTERRTPESSISEDMVRQVASLAEEVAKHLGAPQDIEWAFDGETLYLLQSRPITGLPEVEPIEPDLTPPDDGYWMLDGSHYPSPMSPMAASFYLPALTAAASEAFHDWGLLMEGIQNRTVGWRVYGKLIPLGGKERPAPPWWLMGVLARIAPPIRKQVRKARHSFESGRMEKVIERWWTEWRPEFKAEIKRLESVGLDELDDRQLLDHLDDTISFVRRGQRVHFELFPPYMVAVAELVRFCEDDLGWSKAKATELLGGLSTMSSEPARRLHEVAQTARSNPAITDLLEQEDLSLDTLRAADSEFAEKVDSYLDEFGVRATAYDVIAPTLGEQEHLVLSAIRSEADYDPEHVEQMQTRAREEAIAEAREQLSDDPDALDEFEKHIERVTAAYPVREDNIFFTDNAPVGLVRLTALEIGRRLADRGLIEEPDHAVFLTIEEAKESLTDGLARHESVRTRRGEREWALRHTPPDSFGNDPGPPPDMRAMPEGVRRLMEAISFFMEHDMTAETGDGLSGISASAGSYTGPARVVLTEDDFHRVKPGDVLVCPITTPAWSVLFGRIGGLVTDTGGLLSHSAIVAREHGIPAAVGTGAATSKIEDGQTVTVDGTTGKVKIHD